MKRDYTILFIILLMSFFPSSITAGNQSTYTTTVYKAKKQSEHNQHLDCEGRRIPSIPLCCIISKTDGINIAGIYEDIINYEVWDAESEVYIASFSEENEFIDFLFYQTGNLQIKIETENYNFYGYININ